MADPADYAYIRMCDVDLALGKYESGEWSAPTALSAIRRITAGDLDMDDM